MTYGISFFCQIGYLIEFEHEGAASRKQQYRIVCLPVRWGVITPCFNFVLKQNKLIQIISSELTTVQYDRISFEDNWRDINPQEPRETPHIAFGCVNQENGLYREDRGHWIPAKPLRLTASKEKRYTEDVSVGQQWRTERSTHVKCIEHSGPLYITIWSWECV